MDYISLLPLEILEIILMHSVIPVPPPIKENVSTGIALLRWEEEVKSANDVGILTQLLSPRLVSTHFHAAFWRPFAHVLGDVIFDLRSRDSLANLMTLSSCRNLAPWVKRITIGFYSAPSELKINNLSEEMANALGEPGQKELRRIREVEESWWPEILHFEGKEDEDVEMVSSSGTDWFLDTVGRYFASFNNLEEVCYSFDSRILPAQYRPVLRHFPSVTDFQLPTKTGPRVQRRAHGSLDLLFQTLQSRHIALRRLDISMPRYVGLAYSALLAEALQSVFSCVTDLTLRSCQLKNFDLSWNLLQYCGRSLETLTVIITSEDEKALLPDEEWPMWIPRLMEQIKGLNVAVLRFQIGSDASWARTSYERWHQVDLGEMEFEQVQWLEGVADTVQARPQGLCAWLQRHGAWTGACCEWKDERGCISHPGSMCEARPLTFVLQSHTLNGSGII